MILCFVQVSEFSVHFSIYFPFQLYLHPFHTEENVWRFLSSNWFGLFNCRTRWQIRKGRPARVSLSPPGPKSHLKVENLQTFCLGFDPKKFAANANGHEEDKRTNFHDGISSQATFPKVCPITCYSWGPNLRCGLFGWEIVRLLGRWHLFGHWDPRPCH